MFPDYKCFASYRRLTNKYVILGDNTSVPTEGIGTAIYRLNGKVIRTRNALHVPRLRNPLFSFRLHRRRIGCGAYSAFDVGSYILFPEFALEIDDSHDNILSYESLGCTHSGPCDYAEPRTTSTSQTLDYIYGRTSTTPTLDGLPTPEESDHSLLTKAITTIVLDEFGRSIC